MSNYKEEISQFATLLAEAECVLLGSGAGLTADAGPLFNFADTESFAKNYPSLLQYGFKRKIELMGSGVFKLELQWGYYAQNVQEVRYTDPDFPIYNQLLDIINTIETPLSIIPKENNLLMFILFNKYPLIKNVIGIPT